MYQNDVSITVQRVANALDVPTTALTPNGDLCSRVEKLFSDSPHRGRQKAALIRARVELVAELLGTIQRGEIDDFIEANPAFAASIRAVLAGEEIRGAVETLIRQCDEAVSNGGSKRPGMAH